MIAADRIGLATLATLGALLALSSHARADDPGTNTNAGVAEALFRDGVSLFDAGRVREACAKFGESYRLDPENGTLQNLALCHVREGKTASAWAEFALLAGRAAQAGQKPREQMARQQVATLEPKLARIALVFSKDSGVDEVTVDGEALGRAAWSTPLPLDPGHHELVFRGAGKVAVARRISVPDHAALMRVDVARLTSEAQPAPAAATGAPTPAPTEPATPSSSSTQRTIAYVVTGAGVVALGVGAYFGLSTLSKKNEGDTHCTGSLCDAKGLALEDDAHTSATLSTVFVGAGLAAVGTGIVLLLTAPSSDGASTASAFRVVPTAGPRGAGASVLVRW